MSNDMWDEIKPKPTKQVTMKEGFEDILWEYMGEEFPRGGLTEAIDQAVTSIINLVDKELPTYRDNTDTKEPQPQYDDFISVGYNQAIDDMRAKLKGVSNG